MDPITSYTVKHLRDILRDEGIYVKAGAKKRVLYDALLTSPIFYVIIQDTPTTRVLGVRKTYEDAITEMDRLDYSTRSVSRIVKIDETRI